MKISLSRRGFLKLAGAAIASAYLGGCSECEGVPVSRQTDGQLLPTVASYFKPLPNLESYFNDVRAVTSYTDELADLLNEVWVKEFGCLINNNIRINFLNEVNDGEHGAEYDSWNSTVRIEKRFEPNMAFAVICHEIGHDRCKEEYAPELLAYRLGTMAAIHFPEFGAETDYSTFGVNHTWLHSLILRTRFDSEEKHHISGLAVLLALNQNNGSFAQALNSLSLHTLQQAQTFLEYCGVQPKVENVIEVDPAEPAEKVLPNFPYRTLAFDDLWHKVAHQIIEKNVEFNSALDAAAKQTLKKGLKAAARFPRESVIADKPYFMNPEPIFYKEGFEVPLSFLVTPAGYDYSIPKGL